MIVEQHKNVFIILTNILVVVIFSDKKDNFIEKTKM